MNGKRQALLRPLADFAAGMAITAVFALVVVMFPIAAVVDAVLTLRERRRVT